MAGQFAMPPGYTPLTGSQPDQSQPDQSQTAQPTQPTQPVQATQPTQAQPGQFEVPPGYVPLSSGQPTSQPAAQSTPASELHAAEQWDHTPKATAPIAPPADHKEQLVHSVTGDTGLQLYRCAR